MSYIRLNLIKTLSICLLLIAVGCNDQNKKMSDQDQQAGTAERIKELEAQLDQAARDRAAAEDEILALRAEKDKGTVFSENFKIYMITI